MSPTFRERLAGLRGVECDGVDAVEYEEPATEAIYSVGTAIRFRDGTKLSAQFWRLTKEGTPLISIFDHRRQYGLPAPVDAFQILSKELLGKQIVNASMSATTGDLHFELIGNLVLEVFNFTAFEIWEVTFPDGTSQLSNYALSNRQ